MSAALRRHAIAALGAVLVLAAVALVPLATGADARASDTEAQSSDSDRAQTRSMTLERRSEKDQVTPKVGIAEPEAGVVVSGQVRVSGKASDNVALRSVEVRAGGGRLVTVTVGPGGGWQHDIDTVALTEGALDIVARATDHAGNVAQAAVAVTVSHGGPDGPLPGSGPAVERPAVGPAANPHSVPPGAVPVTPGQDLQAAVNSHPAGTAFLLRAGLHRLQRVHPREGNAFVGERGAVLSGARLLTEFTREGSYWVAGGQTQQGPRAGECEAGYDGCRYPEQLFVDDRPLRQVTRLAELAPGRWLLDYDRDRILLADDPAGRKVETSVVPTAFSGGVRGVTVRGLVIEKYATPAQQGAVGSGGDGWTIEYNELRLNHGAGISTSPRHVIRHNLVHRNGQIGIQGQGDDVVVEANEIAHNNTAGFNFLWEAGGTKFVRTRNLRVVGNYVHRNNGPGLWTDIDNIHTLYQDNLVTDNAGAGIFHEISYDAVIRGNVVERNGFTALSAGILLSGTPNVVVTGNALRGNNGGVVARQENRSTSGRYGPLVVSNLHVHGNVIEKAHGFSGLTDATGDPGMFTSRNNRFTKNTYRLSAGLQRHHWGGSLRDPVGWRAQGQDLDGVWL